MSEESSTRTAINKKRVLYLVTALAVIGISYACFELFFVTRDPIPSKIRSQVSFTLFYPKKMPSGWSIDKSSFYSDTVDQVVGYRLKSSHGDLGITIQPIPKSFNFSAFYTQRLAGAVQFLTPLGQGAIGTAQGQTVGSLETTSSWVLASPTSKSITTPEIQSILSNLQPVSP